MLTFSVGLDVEQWSALSEMATMPKVVSSTLVLFIILIVGRCLENLPLPFSKVTTCDLGESHSSLVRRNPLGNVQVKVKVKE